MLCNMIMMMLYLQCKRSCWVPRMFGITDQHINTNMHFVKFQISSWISPSYNVFRIQLLFTLKFKKKRTKEHHNINPQLSNVYLLQEQTTCIRYIVYCKDEKYDFQYDHIIFETDDYFRPVVDLFSLISLSDG